MKTGEFTLASLAIGCALAAGLAALGFGFTTQALAASVVAVLATFALAPWLRRTLAPAATPDPVQAMVGEEAEVLEAAAPGRAGKVKLNGVIWQAVAEVTLEPGDRVFVAEVDGARLRVLPVDAGQAERHAHSLSAQPVPSQEADTLAPPGQHQAERIDPS
jgi:membrane protein implicated in regulation of membrane protease activity